MSEPTALPTLQIPADVINPIIEAHVRDAVLRAFDGYQPAVQKLISSVLNVRVNASGRPETDRYRMDEAQPWIDWALGEVVRESVLTAIRAKVGEMQAQLEKHIAAELSKKNSPMAKQVAESLLKGFGNIAKCSYALKVEVVSGQ